MVRLTLLSNKIYSLCNGWNRTELFSCVEHITLSSVLVYGNRIHIEHPRTYIVLYIVHTIHKHTDIQNYASHFSHAGIGSMIVYRIWFLEAERSIDKAFVCISLVSFFLVLFSICIFRFSPQTVEPTEWLDWVSNAKKRDERQWFKSERCLFHLVEVF